MAMQQQAIERLTDTRGTEELVIRQCGVSETYPIHTHDFYEFFLVTRGRALHVVNSSTHLIERGSLVLVRPRDVHFYDSYHANAFEFYNMGFSVEEFRRVNGYFAGALDALEREEFPRHVTTDDAFTDSLERLLAGIRERGSGTGAANCRLALSMACGAVLCGEVREPQGFMPDWLFRLLEEMGKPESYVPGLPRLLELANYSQEYVNRVFKRYLKTTPTRFINEKRLAHARLLLEDARLSVPEAAERSGFRNMSHFYERYRSRFGHAPGKARG